jgi:hypothetical protein
MCNNVAGYNACLVTNVIYMINKNTRLLTFLTFIIETDKNIKNKPVQSTNGDNSYTNLRVHANNYTTLCRINPHGYNPHPTPNEPGTVFRRVNTMRSLFYITVFSITHTNSETIFNIFHRSDTKVEK